MKLLLEKIRKFFDGWEKNSTHEKPKTFWKYFIRYTNNWLWTITTIVSTVIGITAGINKDAPVFLVLSIIPFSLLVYNFVDEYYAFQWYITKKRDVSAKTLQDILAAIVAVTLMFVVIRIMAG